MTSQLRPFSFEITQGPSKFDLCVSLFDGNRQGRRIVEFEIKNPAKIAKIKVAINGVDQEDGSGEKWIFRGYLFGTGISCNVHGFLSTQDRKGWIDFEPQGSEAFQYIKNLK